MHARWRLCVCFSDAEKKRQREKSRKDRIRQGIQRLGGLLPTEFHGKDGQKEVCEAKNSFD